MGLGTHNNETLAKVTDYLWRFWTSEDPAGILVPYHWVHRTNGVELPTVSNRRGTRRNRRNRRASSPPLPGICTLPGHCECWSCQVG